MKSDGARQALSEPLGDASNWMTVSSGYRITRTKDEASLTVLGNIEEDEAKEASASIRRVQNNYSTYRLLNNTRSEQLLRLLRMAPTENEDDEITCILFNAPALSAQVKYIALSYCWGDLRMQRSINLIHYGDVNGEVESTALDSIVEDREMHSFSVTENLYAALKSIRSWWHTYRHMDHALARPRLLRIDALCIHQGEDRERTDQVRLMERGDTRGYEKGLLAFYGRVLYTWQNEQRVLDNMMDTGAEVEMFHLI